MVEAEYSSKLTFSVGDWFAWAPGRETRAAWLRWASVPASDETADAIPTLPMMLRRRTTPIGQRAIAAALACRDADAARYVLASRHGEYDRTVNILTSLANREAPSPAEFSMSVHHALVGLLSIHAQNRLGHTAVAAGEDSFGCGMQEAALCIAEDPATPVMLIYYDAPLPDTYEQFHAESESNLPIVVAVLLESARMKHMAYQWRFEQSALAAEENQALVFMKWMLSEEQQAECRGERMTWRWSRVQ
jgi:hypothetical protein